MRYSNQLLTYFHQPRNVGVLSGEHVKVANVGTQASGEIIQLSIEINAENIITHACFKAYGSVPTIALSSWATEWLIGKTLAQAAQINAHELMQLFSLPNVKLHCALLIEDAIKQLIQKT